VPQRKNCNPPPPPQAPVQSHQRPKRNPWSMPSQKPRFHRFIKNNDYSTDESTEDENSPSSMTSTDTSEFDFTDIDETRLNNFEDPNDILSPTNYLERAQGHLARARLQEPSNLPQVEPNLNEERAEDAVPLTDTPYVCLCRQRIFETSTSLNFYVLNVTSQPEPSLNKVQTVEKRTAVRPRKEPRTAPFERSFVPQTLLE
jgi:hypothetical protein